MIKPLSIPLQLSLGAFVCLFASPILAQVTSDGTVNTQVNLQENVSEITGGEARGSNLFHSFQDFSVPTGNEAFFNNAESIGNIFSRVTGGNISNIDGLIRANGSANLFLINPAGIVFGENARLDIGGSFFGSTADSILFNDGEFSATDLDNPPLLTVNAPIGLNFRDNPGDITVRGDGNGARLSDSEVVDTQDALRVGENATIGFLGGNVSFEDATVKTAGGRIEVGGVADGIVNLVAVDNGFTFGYSQIDTFRDISLSGTSSIDASGLGGGDIQAAGNNISITGVSGFTSVTLGSTPGSDIDIFAAESLDISGVENELNSGSGIFSRAFPGSTADAGNINIETGSLTIGDRALINSSVSGEGNAGNVTVNATDSITLASQGNTSGIFSGVDINAVGDGGDGGDVNLAANSVTLSDGSFVGTASLGQGNAGDISIDSNSLSLTNGSSLNANTRALGNAGNISISSANIAIDGQNNSNVDTGVFSNVGAGAVGDAGNVEINTQSIDLQNGSSIDTSSSGQGNGANVTINATDFIVLEGNNSTISSGIGDDAVGNGGDVNLAANSVTLSNGAFINTISSGQGNAGNVTINATDSIVLENSDSSFNNIAITTDVIGEKALGNAGNIEITANSFFNNGRGLFTDNLANGRAGNITIDATEDVSFSNYSGLSVTGAPGGSIDLNAKNLSITSGSTFFAGTSGETGSSEIQAGDITINLEEDLILDELESNDLTQISNSSFGTGNPGDINISARNITFKNGGNISAFSNKQESARIGDVTLNATGDIVFDGISSSSGSGISNSISENTSGSIGTINIAAQNLTLTNGAEIFSSVSGNSDSGNINLDVANSIKIDGFSDSLSRRLPSQISSNVFSTGTGDAGTININTQNLELSRNGSIKANVFGEGNGGDINLNAERITIGQQGNTNILPSNIGAETFGNTEGNGGNITIDTGSLFISDGGSIDVGINGVGNGGNIKIDARDTVSVEGSGIFNDNPEFSSEISANTSNSVGNAGDIEINTANLSVADGAFISADILNDGSVANTGDGGSIIINASDSINVSGRGAIEADIIGPNSTGKAGNLTLSTQRLNVENGAQISATTFSDGDAGSLTITATESIKLDGSTEFSTSGIFASALEGNGKGGDLIISTGDLTISNGAVITASNFSSRSQEDDGSAPGTGQPGEIEITADSINLFDRGRIEAVTQSAEGEGANITLQVSEDITLQDGSSISARAFDSGNGGNLTIDSRFIIAFPSDGNGSDIIASAEQGQGGNITINAESLLGIQERPLSNLTNDINASSEVSGLDGTIDITNPEVDPVQGATELPSNVVQAGETTQQVCQANRESSASNTLTIGGKGGLVPEPGLPLDSFNFIVNGDDSTSTIPAPIETAQGKIQLARGIKVTESGEIILTAYRTNNAGERLPETKNCDRV